MAIRALLIVALLTQQLAVLPCLAICRMVGCADEPACEAGDCCASACEVVTSCASACEQSCEVACEEQPERECGLICHLACASVATQTTEQGQPPAPNSPHVELISLLALPVSFVLPGQQFVVQALTPGVDWAWRSSWTASHPRSMLCCWLI